MMRDIGLLLSVAAIFVFGWFVMRRLDAFLARNVQETRSSAPNRKSVLRIAFSNPMTAGTVSRTLELICKAHPNIEVYLYTADANILLERLHDGRLDAAIIPHGIASEKSCEYDTANILIELSTFVVKDTALPLCPLKTEGVLQQLVWTKGACNGVAEDFAAQVVQDSQQQTGNACWEKV